jgi:uncharacterized SAM-binding protein YcdF (DUF218 family)
MVLAVAILLIAFIVAAFFFPQEFLCVDSGPVKADAIVVLGGGAGDRPEFAAALFKTQAAPEIMVSGAGDDVIDREILLKTGVPPGAIRMESKSRTTSQNAQFTIQLLRQQNIHSVIIVTSWYHSRRALKCFEHYAPEMQFFSRPTTNNEARAGWSARDYRRIYLEYPKLAGYWVRYGVCPF